MSLEVNKIIEKDHRLCNFDSHSVYSFYKQGNSKIYVYFRLEDSAKEGIVGAFLFIIICRDLMSFTNSFTYLRPRNIRTNAFAIENFNTIPHF